MIDRQSRLLLDESLMVITRSVSAAELPPSPDQRRSRIRCAASPPVVDKLRMLPETLEV
jgi:hypothetical protein